MDNNNQDFNRSDESNRIDHQNEGMENSSYQPNFQADFTEPVRPERQQATPYNSTYVYPGNQNQGATNENNVNQTYSNYGAYYGQGNYYNGNGGFGGNDQIPPKKKKRVVLKVALFVLAAVFFGFGSYGVYDHFFVNDKNTVADANKETTNKDTNKNDTNQDNQGALSEDNDSSDVVVQNTTVGDDVGENKVVTVSENTQPSIVAINSTMTNNNLWGQSYDYSGSGSGIIIKQTDSTLLIVTNNHVVEGANNIDVVFTDKETAAAKVKGTDSTSDLAVIEVKLSDIKDSTLKSIKVATLGESEDIKVGEMVVAIGNALGYGQSVTVGYISAKEREVTIERNKMKLLQTDAAINPGNSGGALLNLKGEVIGINSAKFASEEVEGIGYAIPISDAIPIINRLVDSEVLKDEEKGYIGISGSTVTDEMHNSFRYPYGIYVAEVAKGGAADLAGIKAYDIITKLNGSEISTIEGFKERLNSYRAGTKVEITVQRIEDGAYVEKKFTATLQDQKVLDSLQSSENQGNPENNSSNGNNDNGNNNNPYNNDSGDDYSNPYSGDEWPWNLFE